jgi:basic membrane lipoprotein Med (substrate-binding protein (PBP1-ABC) superfamily)
MHLLKANPNITSEYTQPSPEADFTPNLNAYTQKDCDLILAVGSPMADATTTAAKAYPNKKFAIIDASIALPSVYSMQFDTAQAGYLAGYLTAGYSSASDRHVDHGDRGALRALPRQMGAAHSGRPLCCNFIGVAA